MITITWIGSWNRKVPQWKMVKSMQSLEFAFIVTYQGWFLSCSKNAIKTWGVDSEGTGWRVYGNSLSTLSIFCKSKIIPKILKIWLTESHGLVAKEPWPRRVQIPTEFLALKPSVWFAGPSTHRGRVWPAEATEIT
jgi:hypothetical protein